MPGVSPMASNAYPPVGGVNIILGDVIPDAIQVAVGILAQDMYCVTPWLSGAARIYA